MTDAEALDWLDRLLSADEAGRENSLRHLAETNPQLHSRLRRMLVSALSPEHSQQLARPILEGFAGIADVTRTLKPGDVLAGYRLIRELGRGGMSVVWLAERADGVVKRNVALKMPMFMLHGGDQQRFERERDALAALSHPNVARLYDAGVMESGQPFIVLEHVAGEELTAYCDARRLDLRSRIRLFLQVLAAVEHAHKHLVVHRDLKPSNILVDVDGQVRLLDFGIAKLLGDNDPAAALTQQAGGAMTPLYAAPEQIRGETISTLTDVFSLGVVLHELLTGVLPYKMPRQRATVVGIHEALSCGELPRASQAGITEDAAARRSLTAWAKLRNELHGDLDTIVSKALRIAPEDRYASAAHLADDLRRWLDHQPVAARRPGFWYTTRLALRRHRLAASVAGAGVALVAGASVVAWSQHLDSLEHAERTAAVRDFMFELVNDAEANEGHQGEVTGRQMLDGAVLRARRDFGAQPQLQGELLSELGRMYTRLDAPESAVPVLEESIRVLEANVDPDDPALNKSRVFLAGALMQTSDDATRIRSLAAAARAGCANDSVDCRKARGYASNILSQMASFTGDDTQALVEMRRSAVDIEAGFGSSHQETALALMSLAITARNAGELTEAGVSMERALEAARGLRMRAADRVLIDRTMAIIDHDLGRFEAARDRLLALAGETRSPIERARQLRILANVYADMGEGEAALRTADEAIAALPAENAADELPYIRQAHARALAIAGRHDSALEEIDTVIRTFIDGGRAPTTFEVLRAQRYRAHFQMLAGRHAEALRALRELRTRHQAARVSGVETGLMLDLLGEAEQLAGDPAVAREIHEAAKDALARQLNEGHPYLIRNAALQNGAR